MDCRFCGNPLSDQTRVCDKCGQPVADHFRVPDDTGASDRPEFESPAVSFEYGNSSPATPHGAKRPPTVAAPRKRLRQRRPGCLFLSLIVLMIVLILTWVLVKTIPGRPQDLGVRYTLDDYESALRKTGLTVEYVGMTQDEMADLNRSNKTKKRKINDFDWSFSDFQSKRFELTQVEATAFINEFLPAFNWVGQSQVTVLKNGDAAGSYKVYFAKAGEELIPDLIDLIPDPVVMLIPDHFNLSIEGTPFSIINNEIIMPDQLDSLKIGPVSLRPIIGDTDSAIREMVMGYVERIYKQIPQLQIDSLRINSRGNFEFSGRLPTRVTIRKK